MSFLTLTKRYLPAFLISLVVMVPLNTTAGTLDDLLKQVRSARAEESRVNKQREAEFLADKQKQAQLLANAKAALANENARSETLKTSFDENEQKLTEAEESLRIKLGSLGELFGVVRQVAGDTRGVFENSLTSAQYPGRDDQLGVLAQKKELPSIEQLEELWISLLEEMTESGKVVKFPATVVAVDGNEKQQTVTRVGVFNAVSNGKFLRYISETGQLVELPRQPAAHFLGMAKELETASSGWTGMALDPSRGSILALLVQTPNLVERVQQGKLVGYVIIALAAIGLLIVLERMFSLSITEGRIKRQLKSEEASPKNPLGRIMAVYEGNRDATTETLGLKIDEAVLKEVPKVERGLATIKILAAVAPLLGLLGTVTGMIETFQAITLFGTGDPKLMAGGISQALVTTVLGLVAAIPLILTHSMVAAKSKRIVNTLEEQSAGIIALQAEKGLA